MKNQFFPRILDCFFATRPLLLIPVWAFGIFGFFAAQGGIFHRHWPLFSMGIQFHSFVWMVVFSCSVSFVFIINQLADIEADKKNNGLPLIARGIVSIKAATITAWCAAIVSLALPLIFCKYTIALLSLFSMAIGAVYSFRPLRLSGRPYFDFVTNAIGFGVIAFGVGWVCGGKTITDLNFFIDALPYVLLMCAGSISSTLPDIAGDRLDNKMTTAVVLGKRRAHLLATAFILAAAVAAGLDSDIVALICSIVSLQLYLGFIVRPGRLFEEATYKVGGGFMVLMAAAILPIMIPVSLLLYFATSSYFRIRHKMKYPSLVPE
jgi:4-hydroxybenzoate polyprenyltransferase